MKVRRYSLARAWLWEIIAITSSVLVTGVMIVLLTIYDHKPVFLFHGMTLNAIVAFLSTLSKTTLLFALAAAVGQWKWILFSKRSTRIFDAYLVDEASRGPLGSLKLLWRFKGVRGIVNIGAYCTILSLAIDPFTQQLIQFQNFTEYHEDPGVTIPRAQRFSKGLLNQVHDVSVNVTDLGQLLHNDSRTVYTRASADPIVQSAVQYGLVQSNKLITQQLPVQCSTGNCTFKPMQSLAICSQCFDLTDLITVIDDTEAESPQGLYYDQDNGGSMAGNISTVGLPSGLHIANIKGFSNEGYFINLVSRGIVNTSQTTNFQDIDALIWAMEILRVPPAIIGTAWKWPDAKFEALECGIFYCIKGYQSSVRNGVLQEKTVTNVSAKRLPSSWQAKPDGIVHLPETTSIEYQDALSLWDRTDLAFDGDFNVSQKAVASISWHLQRLFAAQLPESEYDQINGFFMNTPDGGSEQFNPDSMKALVRSSNLTQTFVNIALSLTNAIREGADNSTLITGQLGRSETRYVIRWPWITLHAFVILMGVLCLILTMMATTTSRAPVWKSHLLPCFVWGSRMAGALDGLSTTRDMEEQAWKERIRLYLRDHGNPEAEPMHHHDSYAMNRLARSDGIKPVTIAEITSYPSRF